MYGRQFLQASHLQELKFSWTSTLHQRRSVTESVANMSARQFVLQIWSSWWTVRIQLGSSHQNFKAKKRLVTKGLLWIFLMNKILIPYTNRIHNFPNTGWPLYPPSFEEIYEAQSQLLGAYLRVFTVHVSCTTKGPAMSRAYLFYGHKQRERR